MRISQHQLYDFINCHKRYYYKYIERLKAKRIAEHFNIGAALHKGISHWIMTKNESEAINIATERAATQEAVITVHAMLAGFFRKYSNFFKEEAEKVYTEISMEEEIGDHTITYTPDLIFRIKDDQSIWIGEIKTTSSIDDFAIGLALDFQINLYFYMLWKYVEYFKEKWYPSGIWYFAIRKPSIRQKKAETKDEFIVRILREYAYDPSKYFVDQNLVMKKDAFPVEEELRLILKDLELAHQHNLWYCNTRECRTRGKCEFLPICQAFPSHKHLVIGSFYETMEEQ